MDSPESRSPEPDRGAAVIDRRTSLLLRPSDAKKSAAVSTYTHTNSTSTTSVKSSTVCAAATCPTESPKSKLTSVGATHSAYTSDESMALRLAYAAHVMSSNRFTTSKPNMVNTETAPSHSMPKNVGNRNTPVMSGKRT